MLNLITFVQSLSDAAAKSEEAQTELGKRSRLDEFAKTISIVANVAVIVVAYLAYQQYVDANEDLRRGRSLAFVQEWTDKGYSEAYGNISAFVEQKRKDGDTYPSSLPDDAVAIAKFNLGLKWSDDLLTKQDQRSTSLANDLDRTVQFFSRMSTCSNSKLCDEGVLVEYFDTELLTFWDFFSGYAQQRRENGYANYGSKVDMLATRFRSAAHSQ